jgi:hypothetical protein
MKTVQNKFSFPKTRLLGQNLDFFFFVQTSKFGGWLCIHNAYIKVLDPGDTYLNPIGEILLFSLNFSVI